MIQGTVMLNAAYRYNAPDRPNFRANFATDRLVGRTMAGARLCSRGIYEIASSRDYSTALLEIPTYFVASLAESNWIQTSSSVASDVSAIA